MSEFEAAHMRRTHVNRNRRTGERGLSVVHAEGRESWVDGWKPVYLHPRSGETCAGQVFTTVSGDDKTYPSVADLRSRAAHGALCAGDASLALRLRGSRLHCDGAARTRVQVSYTYTALTEAGNAFLAAFTESD